MAKASETRKPTRKVTQKKPPSKKARLESNDSDDATASSSSDDAGSPAYDDAGVKTDEEEDEEGVVELDSDDLDAGDESEEEEVKNAKKRKAPAKSSGKKDKGGKNTREVEMGVKVPAPKEKDRAFLVRTMSMAGSDSLPSPAPTPSQDVWGATSSIEASASQSTHSDATETGPAVKKPRARRNGRVLGRLSWYLADFVLPTSSDGEFRALGFAPEVVNAAFETVENFNPNNLGDFTREQLSAVLDDPESASKIYHSLWARSDSYASAMKLADENAPRPHTSLVSIFAESTLVNLAERQFRGPFSKDPDGLYFQSQRRYLKALKYYLQVVNRLSDAPDDTHMRGLLLDLLDLYPRWVQTVVEGAVQHSNGKGSLAAANFAWSDVSALQGQLDLAAPYYHSAASRATELRQTLAGRGLANIPSTSMATHVPDVELLAARLVSHALSDLDES
ncbi:hypothetical protein P7C70_g6209, partial [Phenoliferia sp. Uapishka_3]